jgi:hypothetical protein
MNNKNAHSQKAQKSFNMKLHFYHDLHSLQILTQSVPESGSGRLWV